MTHTHTDKSLGELEHDGVGLLENEFICGDCPAVKDVTAIVVSHVDNIIARLERFKAEVIADAKKTKRPSKRKPH